MSRYGNELADGTDLVQMRWLQKETFEGADVGPPVLQWRVRIKDGWDGEVSISYYWTQWEAIPTVREEV